MEAETRACVMDQNEFPCIVVLSTAPPGDADRIAKILLEDRLVACVNITGVQSRYTWKGEQCLDNEHLMILKTVERNLEELIERIREIHPYETPEIIALPVMGGFDGYLRWVVEETQ
jgi:periplasmic divalent cation tolerance protein